jgi:hypothetical protein
MDPQSLESSQKIQKVTKDLFSAALQDETAETKNLEVF